MQTSLLLTCPHTDNFIIKALFKVYQFFKKAIFSLREKENLIFAQDHWIEIFEEPSKSPLIKDRIYEQETTLFIRNYLKNEDVVYDVGANIGYFTLEFARLVGKRGKVISFEPHPEIYKVLKRNVKRNKYKNVSLKNVACGESNSQMNLYLSTENEGNHKIVDNDSTKGSVSTKVVRLSDFIGQTPPRLIKMDIEGAELLAIKGVGTEILANKEIDFVLEYHPYEMAFFDIEGYDILELLSIYDYKFRNLAYGDFPIIKKDEILATYRKEDRGITNLFCSRNINQVF